MITLDQAREAFSFDAERGVLVWKIPMGKALPGDVAGKIRNTGYVQIYYRRATYPAHRLIWFYAYGEWPKIVDHVNGDKADNRLSNLRSVDTTTNNQNVRQATSANRLGVLGVFKLKNSYVASINIDGKKTHLGCFRTLEEAQTTYLEAKRRHHEGCTI